MRWEDQELNYGIPETTFPEILEAKFALLAQAERSQGRYASVDEATATRLPLKQFADRGPVRINRLCLHFRLACRISPGGGAYAELGAFHYWSGRKSMYAIAHISPKNDWMELMCVAADEPNQLPRATGQEKSE
jgi:hypothetical protein